MTILKFFFALALFLFPVVSESAYKFEGYFKDHDGELRFHLIGLFLPYNPSIHIFSNDPEIVVKCSNAWPKADTTTEVAKQNQPCDFLWIDSVGDELQILKTSPLRQTKLIYTTTHFFNKPGFYKELSDFLKNAGFTLLSHWYWEGKSGHAIFLRNDVFDAAMRSLNYSPGLPHCHLIPSPSNTLEQFFLPAKNKSKEHTMDEIDQIYMINLDERPEKFAATVQNLQAHGISPCRFSAVNGWKLPTEVLNKIGVQYVGGMSSETFMGTTYRSIDGQEYKSNECIQEEGVCYFSLGMSRGAIGIVLSHLSVLNDAYKSGYNTIWVMEDDVEVMEDPGQISDVIWKMDLLEENWDILFTDTDTKDSKGNHIACRSIAARPNLNIEPLSSFLKRFYRINEDYSRIGMRYGAYSMIIRRSGMKKILDYFKTYQVFLPYDMDFWLIPDLRMYSCNKDIVSHKAGSLSDNGLPNFLNKNEKKVMCDF